MPSPKPEPTMWVRYEPRFHLADAALLSPAAELAHRRFADSVWATGRWPAADAPCAHELARVTLAEWPAIETELRNHGWRTRAGRLFHSGIHSVLVEARKATAHRTFISASANKSRWHSQHVSDQPLTEVPESKQLKLAPPALPSGVPSGVPSGIPSGLPPTVTVQNSNSTAAKAVNRAELLQCSGSQPPEDSGAEKELMTELLATLQAYNGKLAAKELTNWGGWWRNRFRENPAKTRRVLAEIKSMIRERRMRRNPGAAANDLWSRFA